MRKHVLILGAGFGGLELATVLSERHGDAVSVTLLDRNDSFHFGFSKLDVMLGRRYDVRTRTPTTRTSSSSRSEPTTTWTRRPTK
jgi:sulfide:quinone oxidoreductase